MSFKCPGTASKKDFDKMVEVFGENISYLLWHMNNGQPLYNNPDGTRNNAFDETLKLKDVSGSELKAMTLIGGAILDKINTKSQDYLIVDINSKNKGNKVEYSFEAVKILQSPKAKQIFEKGLKNNWNIDKIIQELQIPKEQKQLIIDSYNNGNKTPESLAIDIANKYSYSVEINTAKVPLGSIAENEERIDGRNELESTAYYSNLTVPGGINYTENEIATPGQLVEERPQGISTKQGVPELFESNPELANIGTQQQYSQYLDTIFPDSKVKDIVYHGSNQKIEQFEIRKEPLIHFGTKSAALQRGNVLNQTILNIKDLQTIKDGMWFLGTDKGGLLKELLNRNILTIEEVKSVNEAKNKAIEQSPYFHEDYRMAIPEGTVAGAKKLQEILKDRNIGFKYINLSEDKGSTSYAVPSPEQIHILGSKQDMEGFKKFIKDNTKSVRKNAITPSIKGHAQFSTDKGIGWFRSDERVSYTMEHIDFVMNELEKSGQLKIECD